MKKHLLLPVLYCTLAATALSSCSSTTVIHSHPEGAKLYMDEEYMGLTPYTYSDTKLVGSSTAIKIIGEGYPTYQTVLSRDERADVGAIIGGIFFLVPFLWTMEYNPAHVYDLTQSSSRTIEQTTSAPPPDSPPQSLSQDRLARLSQLKKLLDNGTLTKEEFDREKQKILDEK